MWLDELEPQEVALLSGAYLRRKKWEHKALALEVVNTLGKAMNGKGNNQDKPNGKGKRSVLREMMRRS